MKTSAEKTGRHHRRMSCRRVRAALVDYLEGQLSADEQDQVSAHLQSCKRCAAERMALKKTLQVLSCRELPEPDERFWMDMKQRVREGLKEEQMTRRQPSPVPARTWIPAAAVAAAVVFLFLWWTRLPVPPAPVSGQMLSRLEQEGRQSLMTLGQDLDITESLPMPGSPGDSLISLLAAASRPSETLEQAIIGNRMKQQPDLWGAVIEEEISSRQPVDMLLKQLSEAQLRTLSARLSRLAG